MVTNFIVREKECNIKHQQIVSGVSLSSYWLANFTLDYLKFFPFAILCPLVIYLFDQKMMIDNGNFSYFIVLCLIFGFACIMFAYFISFYFNQSWNAQIQVFLLSFMTGIIMPIIIWIFKIIPGTMSIGNTYQWFFRIPFPMYCFGSGIMTMTSKGTELKVKGYDDKDPGFD